MAGDIIIAVGGRRGGGDLIRLLDGERIGRGITIDVLRAGRTRVFDVVPRERAGS